ncbi:MAG: N-acetylglucosamine-6-phosphate deacetylase [Bryobacterales bacterium]|nr:N-acetylglucosamine-6-phosphate deacetylase [Bryobacterales bacterium]
MPSADYVVIHNGTVLTDFGEIPNGMVVVRGRRIDFVGRFEPSRFPEGTHGVDARGMFIAPGFVDIHVHGGAGADFMDATADAVETVFRYHLAHGTTTLCPTTATAPREEILEAIGAIEQYRTGEQAFGRVHGVHVEGPYLAPTKRGCHLPDQVRSPEPGEWKAILERGRIASMTLAPELPGARPLIEALVRQGAVAAAGHSEALYHEMESAMESGVSHVTHLYCAMTSALSNRWRGTPHPRAAGMLEAVYLEDKLTSELIADGKHLAAQMVRLAVRIKGPERLAIVTDAMRGAGMPDGEYTFGSRRGSRAVVRNRESRIPDGTALASSVFPMNEMVRIVKEQTGIRWWEAVRMASLTPAEAVGASGEVGSLTPGKWADIVLFDEQVQIRQVFLGGQPVQVPGLSLDPAGDLY